MPTRKTKSVAPPPPQTKSVPPAPPQTKSVVIGSGFGGLATAIRLQAAGMSTTVLEKQDLPGGRAYVFHDQGFTFDAGPTVITAPDCLEELFGLTGRRMSDYIEMKSILPFYRLLWDDGYVFDYSNEDEKLFSQIRKKNPADEQGYRDFLKYSQEVFNEGYSKLAAVPFLSLWDMVKVSPQLIRLGAYRSVYSMVAKYIKDEQLRQAFSFHSLLVGGNPFKASSIYTLIHFLEKNWGVYFPMGGTGALVQALVKYFTDIGGQIHYRSEVDEILTEQNRVTGVRTKAGKTYNCHAVVSNGDVLHTYKDLLRHQEFGQQMAHKLAKKSYSMSLFLIYFGVNKIYDKIAHHNVIFGPRYRALLADIFDKGVLPDDFSLYLHAPSLTDPSLAPPGCQAFYVLSPVGHLGKLDFDWQNRSDEYADKILAYLESKYLPRLRQHIVTKRYFTPLDFQRRLNSHVGAAFSLEPLLTQSAYFRLHNRDAKIQGLYFAGAGTHPGAGVPGVVNSGKATAALVLEDFL
ncbi:MAG: phytoene desaturase [Bdellovibrio sp.]|nr:MAG: phytoene desaturase [Bdellovibrio sp.]